uniref:Pre-mRNA-splicing factor 38 n=1 Tax=Steinernema glaseri TaxID=37863 RepID=A0A1I8ATJ6_9BILA
MNPADAAAAAVQAMHFAGVAVNNEIVYEDDATDNTIPDIQKITKKNNVLPLWGNNSTMNLNPLVLENIIQCTYYKNYLSEATGFQQLSDECYYNVAHLEPWERGTRKTQGMTGMCGGVRGVGAGGVVSTAFCLMYKMFTMRLTRKQLVSMINSTQSVYLRGLGFMYIRFTQPPPDLWAWMEPYFDDDEEIDPRSGGGDKMTIGQMLRTTLTKLDWYGTLFPRIPVPIQKEIEQKFRERAQAEEDARERRRDERNRVKEHKAMFSGDGPSTSKEERLRKRSAEKDGADDVRRSEKHARKEESAERKRHRCKHHLKHHHCRKHRTQCPKAPRAATSDSAKEKKGD